MLENNILSIIMYKKSTYTFI